MSGDPFYPEVMARGDVRQLTETFVELADTLVDEFDTMELLHVLAVRCVRMLDVDAAGVMIIDQDGALRVAAASSERTRLLELFEVQNEEGPCLDCLRTGTAVSYVDLTDAQTPWPRFSVHATKAGFASAHALPMRLRQQVIGALNLFRNRPVALADDDVRVAQAFADIATIAILQDRIVQERHVLAEQLQTALSSRVVIEQAKGVLAERRDVDMETAFATLRSTARRSQRRLTEVARELVDQRGQDAPPA